MPKFFPKTSSLMPTPAEREQERLRKQQQLLAQKERLRGQISDLNKRMQTRPPSAMQQAQRGATSGAAVSSPFGPIGSAMPMPQMPQMPQVPPEVQQATVERMEAHRQEISKLERSILLGNQKLQQNPNNIALRQSVEAAQRRLLELSTMEEDQTLESAMPVGPVRP